MRTACAHLFFIHQKTVRNFYINSKPCGTFYILQRPKQPTQIQGIEKKS